MTRVTVWLGRALGVAAAIAGLALGSDRASIATARAPIVPPHALSAIKRQVNPLYTYAPRYVPAGARYWQWESSTRWLTIRFRKDDGLEAVWFSAGPYPQVTRPCRGGAHAGKRFQISGVRVYWAATYEDQEAWRCVKSHGKLVVLAAGQSISGRGASNPRSHWARDLARVVASGRRIS